MASNSRKRQEHPHAHVATLPDSPSRGCSPKHAEKHNQPIVDKIRQLLSDMKGDPGLPSDSQTARSFEVQLEHLMTATRNEKSSDTAVDQVVHAVCEHEKHGNSTSMLLHLT
jgi:hypothetical protein